MRFSNLFLTLTGTSLGLVLGACLFHPIPDHCRSRNGDVTCAEEDRGMYCDTCDASDAAIDRNGCTDELPSADCRFLGTPDAGSSSTSGGADDVADGVDDDGGPGDDDGMTVGVDGSGTDTAVTGGPTDGGDATTGPGDTDTGSSTDGPMGCMGDDECTDADAPACVDKVCVVCSAGDDPDAACAGLGAGTDVCDGGACVQCTAAVPDACTGVTPLCDAGTSSCVGCTSHDQCPDSACHIPSLDAGVTSPDDGACFGVGTVVHVDGDGGQDVMTLQAAVDGIAAGGDGVLIVHNAAGDYNAPVSIGGDRAVAFLAADGEAPNWIQSSNGAGASLDITGGDTVVYLHHMRLASNADPSTAAVVANAGRLHATRSEIVNNDGGGIRAENGGVLDVVNCFVGGDVSDIAALEVASGSATILYSTLGAGFGASAALTCTDPDVVIRNSLVVSRSNEDEVQCPGASIVDTATETQTGDVQTAWFDGYNSGDFHLSGAAPGIISTTAEWQTGDPSTDIDDDPRPDTNGAADVAGADVQ